MATDNWITPIDLCCKTASTFYLLKTFYHKDLSDRLLIWQCIKDNYVFFTDDENIKFYKSERLKIIK